MPSLITLTSDLGEQEPFAASIKGAIYSLCREANVVDLSHQVSPHDVTEGALFVLGAVPYFPEGTVHLINVAPGPEPVAVASGGQIILCPNNGILTLLAEHQAIDEVYTIPIPENIANRNEQTFFGREVFAPAAAAIAGGKTIADLGGSPTDLKRVDWPHPERSGSHKLEGRIMHVDRFGNLITNLHRSQLEEAEIERIGVGNFSIFGLSECYTDVMPHHPLALIGHSGYLEIAYNGDRANDRLGLNPGIHISVFLAK